MVSAQDMSRFSGKKNKQLPKGLASVTLFLTVRLFRFTWSPLHSLITIACRRVAQSINGKAAARAVERVAALNDLENRHVRKGAGSLVVVVLVTH